MSAGWPCDGASLKRTFRGMTVFVDLGAEVVTDILCDLQGKSVAPVEHRQHQSLKFQRRVQRLLDLLDGAQELGQALEGKELAL